MYKLPGDRGEIRFFYSSSCSDMKYDKVKEYVIEDKRTFINSLRNLLKNNLSIDERKYIQALLLRVNKDIEIDEIYYSDEIIKDNKEGNSWCYICKKFVATKIDRCYYEQFIDKNCYEYNEEFNNVIESELAYNNELLHRCKECNTQIVKLINRTC